MRGARVAHVPRFCPGAASVNRAGAARRPLGRPHRHRLGAGPGDRDGRPGDPARPKRKTPSDLAIRGGFTAACTSDLASHGSRGDPGERLAPLAVPHGIGLPLGEACLRAVSFESGSGSSRTGTGSESGGALAILRVLLGLRTSPCGAHEAPRAASWFAPRLLPLPPRAFAPDGDDAGARAPPPHGLGFPPGIQGVKPGFPDSSPRRVGGTDAPVSLPPRALARVRAPLRRSRTGSRRLGVPRPSTPGASSRRPPSDRPLASPGDSRRRGRLRTTRPFGCDSSTPAGSCSAFALGFAP